MSTHIKLIEVLRESPINIVHAAEKLGVSTRTLVRLVRRTTGMTFLQLKDQIRLEEAKRRIAEGTPILTVALALGFSSTQAFTTWFRKRQGLPPARFRVEIKTPTRSEAVAPVQMQTSTKEGKDKPQGFAAEGMKTNLSAFRACS